MMYLKQLFLALVGTSFGVFAAGGVFTVLISVGLIPRFAGKMHASKKVFLFEEAVVFGVMAGTFFSVFDRYGKIGEFVRERQLFGTGTDALWDGAGTAVVIAFGLFAGIFVGCLALAIAEMLDTIPIFARRIGFRHGLGIVVLSIALGKAAGSLLYFMKAVYLHGGM